MSFWRLPLLLSSAAVASVPAASRRTRTVKCDHDVKLHVSKTLYDDLIWLAERDQRPVSEYVRVLLEWRIGISTAHSRRNARNIDFDRSRSPGFR
jgi:hypothetical protein